MIELIFSALITIVPDYLYRHYKQGKRLGYEPLGDTQCTEAPGGRKTVIWTLVKEV